MVTFIFDGTFNGLLTCVFYSFKTKTIPQMITSNSIQLDILTDNFTITTDKSMAQRVEYKLRNCAFKTAYNDCTFAFLSGDQFKNIIIFNYISLAVQSKIDISSDFSKDEILLMHKLKHQISLEIHRFKGLVRFLESEAGYYYSHITPDNNITNRLAKHFIDRFKNQAFIIHDTKRNNILIYDGSKCKYIENFNSSVEVVLSNDELTFERLWKQYYNAVNIESRKNLKQMRGYMPKRYWKNLTEL